MEESYALYPTRQGLSIFDNTPRTTARAGVNALYGDALAVADGLSQRPIMDKTVIVKQLHVVEAHGILLFRTDKMGKSGIPRARKTFNGVSTSVAACHRDRTAMWSMLRTHREVSLLDQ